MFERTRDVADEGVVSRTLVILLALFIAMVAVNLVADVVIEDEFPWGAVALVVLVPIFFAVIYARERRRG